MAEVKVVGNNTFMKVSVLSQVYLLFVCFCFLCYACNSRTAQSLFASMFAAF